MGGRNKIINTVQIICWHAYCYAGSDSECTNMGQNTGLDNFGVGWLRCKWRSRILLHSGMLLQLILMILIRTYYL